ncbi:hypothetical protein ACIQ7Q_07510 [Streptomyces sp. NPDC096176]|uniref:hypothetical protein n=1 Tax=Streptomyces sp. NPDC096176 TaxID=3366079 RepID=UPI0037F9DAD3
MNNDDEPVFKRSTWGTNRYYYNPNNPVGLFLIIASVVFAIVMMVMMEYRVGPFAPPSTPTWSPPAYDEWTNSPRPQTSNPPSSAQP